MKSLPAIFFICIFVFITNISCKKADISKSVPDCIEQKINELKNTEVYNPPAQVWEWKVDDKTYYYFTSNCCDQYNILYDEDCNIVCAPDGGFTGKGDGNCPEFKGKIVKTLIWEDTRR
jgi:hypothetical protein